MMLFDQEKAINDIEKISFNIESFTLPNGLRVVLRNSEKIPAIAVAVMYHVGASRETKGKTGLAHLFEHMMFQNSEHIKEGDFFRIIKENGGELNGGTWQDGTMYYEIVPQNMLEKVLWLESDRMGYLLNAITHDSLANEINVVLNEKRQRYDNQPYGYKWKMINMAVYPEDHPYYIDTIGEPEDLVKTTVEDLKKFFKQWYGPNNAVLVINGNIKNIPVRKLVEKYFCDIPSGSVVTAPDSYVPSLKNDKKMCYRDARVQNSKLIIAFPTVEEFHKDRYSLEMLGDILANTKSSPLYKKLVEELKLCSSVSAYHNTGEIASLISIFTHLHEDAQIQDVYNAIKSTIQNLVFDNQSFLNIQKTKARLETSFYETLESNLEIAYHIARSMVFYNDPLYFKKEILKSISVTDTDVQRVFEKYIRNSYHACIQMAPEDESRMFLDDSVVFTPEKDIKKEKTNDVDEFEKEISVSSFDRSKEPQAGDTPTPLIPTINSETLNEMKVGYISNKTLPVVSACIRIPFGVLHETKENNGTTKLISYMLKDGTLIKSATEFEDELALRGITLNCNTGEDSIYIRINMPSRIIDDGADLLKEMLEKPLLSDSSFEKYRAKNLASLNSIYSSNDSIADYAFDIALYEEGSPSTFLYTGTEKSLAKLTGDSVRKYYKDHLTARGASVAVAGYDAELFADKLSTALLSIDGRAPVIPDVLFGKERGDTLYIVHVPGSAQSEIRIGCEGPRMTNNEFYPLLVANYMLGGAISINRLSKVIREEKGYTYGISSNVDGGLYDGVFSIVTGVHTEATADSIKIIKDIVSNYADTLTDNDYKNTVSSILLSYSRMFETNNDLVGRVNKVVQYGLSPQYTIQRMDFLKKCTKEELQNVFSKWIKPEKLVYVVVGDKEKYIKELEGMNFKNIIELDKYGNKLK